MSSGHSATFLIPRIYRLPLSAGVAVWGTRYPMNIVDVVDVHRFFAPLLLAQQ
jgi:hypothetical protein